jgi:DeoR/GlpR family transcriptional regulator of sugar metabolism
MGYIHLVKGGALRKAESPIAHIEFAKRLHENKHLKGLIAQSAVSHFVEMNDIIILEGGSTVSLMATHLAIPGVTVITDGPAVVNYAAKFLKDIKLICCGGILRAKEFTFVGPQAEDFFTHYRASKCFISAYGFSFRDGLMDYSHDDIRVKQSMIAHSQQTISLLDSSKIGVTALIPSARAEQIDIIITDSGIKPPDMKRMESMGIQVHIANTVNSSPPHI